MNHQLNNFSVDKIQEEVLSEFPELKDTLFFLKPTKNTNFKDEISKLSSKIGKIIPKLSDENVAISSFQKISTAFEIGMCSATHFYEESNIANVKYVAAQVILPPLPDANYKISNGKIEVDFSENTDLSIDESLKNEALKHFILDHEIGHVLSRKVLISKEFKDFDEHNLSESVADAYALIKHYKRYGSETDCVQDFIDLRFDETSDFSKKGYDTVQTMKEIAKLSKEKGFSNISSREAIKLAIEVSKQNVLLKPNNELDNDSKFKINKPTI